MLSCARKKKQRIQNAKGTIESFIIKSSSINVPVIFLSFLLSFLLLPFDPTHLPCSLLPFSPTAYHPLLPPTTKNNPIHKKLFPSIEAEKKKWQITKFPEQSIITPTHLLSLPNKSLPLPTN
ncbi:hypothetical protein OCU04_007111 [Sclerotinia nivalis]|uniref:Uncharacterized protein n=1 Tax=Sclerotinia nivalis TaxID=352851 RepID=A0A9X0DII6_9HELO|nr:hypothetical protein OCU04_007111 [Sclerotinia nivalis]